MSATDGAYFEDLAVGQSFVTPAITLTEAHVTQFLGLTAEWHDDSAGSDGCVPDLLPLCLSSGLGWRVPVAPLAILAFMRFEWRFLKPLCVGDTIHNRFATVSLRSLREGGVVVESREVIDQRGEVAQRGRLTLLVARRAAAER